MQRNDERSIKEFLTVFLLRLFTACSRLNTEPVRRDPGQILIDRQKLIDRQRRSTSTARPTKKENEDELERDDSGAYWWGDDDEGKYGLLNHDTKVC